MKKLPRDAEASNVLVGEVDFLDSPFVAFVRLQQAVMLGALTEVPVPTRYLLSSHKAKEENIVVVEGCSVQKEAFIKPKEKVYVLHLVIFVIVFPRFLFILLGPKGKAKSYHEIGRAIATLMSDEVCTD